VILRARLICNRRRATARLPMFNAARAPAQPHVMRAMMSMSARIQAFADACCRSERAVRRELPQSLMRRDERKDACH